MSLEIRSITTNITCNVSGGDGHLTAEVDPRQWGLNSGKTQFYEGDNAGVLVYISKNVHIVGSFVIGGTGTQFNISQNAPPVEPSYFDPGILIVREAISFSNPVASLSKPPSQEPKILAQQLVDCGDPYFMPYTTHVKLNLWEPTLQPHLQPPYGNLFIEYTPAVVRGDFIGLGAPDREDMASYTNSAVIFGISRPIILPI